jgi:LPS-assembly protein
MLLGGARTRAAFLVVCILAAAFAAEGARAAQTTAPDQQVLMRADQITYDTQTSVVSAQGHVEIDYEDRILLANELTYDQKSDTVTASGKISVLAPDGSVAFADHVVLTSGMRDGVLEGFQALIAKSGRLAANRAVREGQNMTYAERAAYTPCKICDKPGERTPTWEVRASKIIWDEQHHRIFYHDATLELFGVPIFYTPIFSHADPSVKHKTGLLVPEIGSSTAIGSFATIPLYVSLSDSQDLTLAPMITTGGGDILETEFRQRWNDGGMWLQATGGYNPDGGLTGHQHQWYSSLFGSGHIPFTNVWSTGYDVALSSNDTYLKRYDISEADNLVSDLYLEAISGRSRLALTGYFFQDLRACPQPPTPGSPCTPRVSSSEIPIVLPLFEYSYIPRRDPFGGQFRFDLSSASVMRDLGADSERMSSEMRWQLPFVTGNGQVITLTGGARGDVYRVSASAPVSAVLDVRGNPLPTGTNYISRGQPYAAVDWRWPFVSTGRRHGAAFVVEPIVQLIEETYGGNPAGIPNEDSTDFELDETDVFSIDRIPGHALWESGPRANIGIQTEAYLPTGSIEVLVGEVLRPKTDSVLAAETGFGDKTSDLVGRYTVRFPPYLSLTHRVDIDTSGGGGIRRNEVYLDGTYGRSNVEVSYIKLDQAAAILGGAREEANAQFTLALLDNWALFAAARRNLEQNTMLNTAFGLGWEDDCLGFSVSYERRYTRILDVPPSTSILFRVKLKVGPDDQDWTLFPSHIFATP